MRSTVWRASTGLGLVNSIMVSDILVTYIFQFFSISKENSSKRENGRSCIQANSAAGICGDIIKDYFEKEKREKKRKKQEKGVCL